MAWCSVLLTISLSVHQHFNSETCQLITSTFSYHHFFSVITLPLMCLFPLMIFFIIRLIICLAFLLLFQRFRRLIVDFFLCVSFSFGYNYALHNVIVCYYHLFSFEDIFFSFWTLYFYLVLSLQMISTWAFGEAKSLTTKKLRSFLPCSLTVLGFSF